MEQIKFSPSKRITSEGNESASEFAPGSSSSEDDVQITKMENDKGIGNGDEANQLITSGIDIGDVDIMMEEAKDEALAAFIQSSESLERDISSIMYSRVFELIPFVNSYCEMKP